jgi:hypothetical protein
MLQIIVIILIILWLIGLIVHVAGAFIHFLLIIGVAVLAYDLITKHKK